MNIYGEFPPIFYSYSTKNLMDDSGLSRNQIRKALENLPDVFKPAKRRGPGIKRFTKQDLYNIKFYAELYTLHSRDTQLAAEYLRFFYLNYPFITQVVTELKSLLTTTSNFSQLTIAQLIFSTYLQYLEAQQKEPLPDVQAFPLSVLLGIHTEKTTKILENTTSFFWAIVAFHSIFYSDPNINHE